MRRILVLLAGVGMLPAAVGCKHTAGFCDCQPPIHPCCQYGLYPATLYEHATVPAAQEPPVATPEKERLGPPREGI